MIPTVGFNMRKVTKGNVTIKVVLIRLVKKMSFTRNFSCGTLEDSQDLDQCGSVIVEVSQR